VDLIIPDKRTPKTKIKEEVILKGFVNELKVNVKKRVIYRKSRGHK